MWFCNVSWTVDCLMFIVGDYGWNLAFLLIPAYLHYILYVLFINMHCPDEINQLKKKLKKSKVMSMLKVLKVVL